MKRCIIKYFLLLTFISINLIIDANAITQQDFINKYLKDRKLEIFEGTWITNSGNIYGVYNNGETFQMIAIESVNFSSGDVIGNFKKASDTIFIGEEKIFYKKKYNVRSRYTIDNNKAYNVLYYQLSNTNLLDYRLWPTDIYEHNDKFMTNNEKVELEAAQLKAIKEVFPANNLASAYALIAVPARMAIENKNWEVASQLELPVTKMNWDEAHWSKAMLHFSRALGFSNTGNPKEAEKELDILIKLRDYLLKAEDTYASGQVTIQINSTKAWIELAKGNTKEAVTLMKLAADLESKTSKAPVTPGEIIPANELLANLYLAINKPEKALETYKLNLNEHPFRFNGIYGAARAAIQLNKTKQAVFYFEQLVSLGKVVKNTRKEITEAKEFIKKHKILNSKNV